MKQWKQQKSFEVSQIHASNQSSNATFLHKKKHTEIRKTSQQIQELVQEEAEIWATLINEE
eukprot:snap_masked-scaffold_9-processed-gene-6.35-mRNA-1 protein AED:1.00 eAED:1.00 QI:0/-1/0/0/-1/1/1/0/60